MPDNKLTDNEIIEVFTLDKAIEHCYEIAKQQCNDCGKEHLQLAKWLEELKTNRDLINRLQAENERLKNACKKLVEMQELYKDNMQATREWQIKQAKAEAYKEFADSANSKIDEAIHNYEKVKKKHKSGGQSIPFFDNDDIFFTEYNSKINTLKDIKEDIDNLLKELVGDSDV